MALDLVKVTVSFLWSTGWWRSRLSSGWKHQSFIALETRRQAGKAQGGDHASFTTWPSHPSINWRSTKLALSVLEVLRDSKYQPGHRLVHTNTSTLLDISAYPSYDKLTLPVSMYHLSMLQSTVSRSSAHGSATTSLTATSERILFWSRVNSMYLVEFAAVTGISAVMGWPR